METPQKRLEKFIENTFGAKKAFTDYLGVHQTFATKYTGRGKSIIRSTEIVAKLALKGFDYNYYLTGEKDLNIDNASNEANRVIESLKNENEKLRLEVIKLQAKNEVLLELIHVERRTEPDVRRKTTRRTEDNITKNTVQSDW